MYVVDGEERLRYDCGMVSPSKLRVTLCKGL